MVKEVKAIWSTPAAKVGVFAGSLLLTLAGGTMLGSRSAEPQGVSTLRLTVEEVARHAVRLDTLDAKMARTETVNRFVACVLRYDAPDACESHLAADVIESLRPR